MIMTLFTRKNFPTSRIFCLLNTVIKKQENARRTKFFTLRANRA